MGLSSTSLLRLAHLLCWALIVCCPIGTPASEARPSPRDSQGAAPTKPAPHVSPGSTRPTGKKLSPTLQPASSQETGSKVTTPKPDATPRPETPSPPAAPKEDIIEIVLTFDDGPHADPLVYGTNYTYTVFSTLKNNVLQKDIKAVFFVQTHAPGRGGTPTGRQVIATLARGGHVIGIHTGSTKDHASHCLRAKASPYDANGNGVRDAGDGTNGLESDMVRAKVRIRSLTGNKPLYVRPTYGRWNRVVTAVYRRQNLKMILWDIDSGDNTGSPSVDDVNRNIHKGLERCIAADKKHIVILFHDINSTTALNLEEYLGNICISAKKLGKTAVFPTSAQRVIEILNARTKR